MRFVYNKSRLFLFVLVTFSCRKPVPILLHVTQTQ